MVTATGESAADSAEERLARLIDRLLAGAEAAAGAGDWEQVNRLAHDVLDVAPDDDRAQALLRRADAEQPRPEDQRAFVTLLFSDIARSTDLADVSEPEIIRDLYRIYRQAATSAIEALGGNVLQFQGDGIVACFGYPDDHEDDAKRAVLAALGIVERMQAAAAGLHERYGIEAPVRVGVHTGTVVVAGLGSSLPEASDVVGVVTNVTARLQAEADPNTVVISDVTRQLVEHDFELVPVGTRSLKGIARPVQVYRVARPRSLSGGTEGARPKPASLVGREGPRRRLHQGWDVALGGRDGDTVAQDTFVTVHGPAGIGKSRLAADLCQRVQADGGIVLQAVCSPYHTNVALWPIRLMVEHRLGLYPDQPHEERLAVVEGRLEAVGMPVAGVVPLLAPLLGLEGENTPARPEVDALALRAETLNALADWLIRSAQMNPTLLVVEDLHWADPTTSDLLGLIAGGRGAGVMVVVTSREPITTPWAHSIAQIELGPLDETDAASLVAGMAEADQLTAGQCAVIIERGAGIPLFIEELARSAVDATAGQLVPPRLMELLAARLRTHGVNLRVAQLAATIGAVFDENLLRELVGGPVAEALAGLQTAGIVDPAGDARGAEFRFRHVLLREAAYETQVLDARRSTHARIAGLLGATAGTPGDLAIVAQHLDLAGDAGQSVPAYIAAAQAAQGEASHTEARRLLDRAIELLDSFPEGDERELSELMIRMLRSMSTSSLFGYGYPDVYEDFQLADRICRRHRDRPEIMPAQIGVWSYMLVRGDLDAAVVVLEPLVDSVDAPEMGWFAPEIKSCLGYSDFYRGELKRARQWLEEAWAGYGLRPAEATFSPFWPLPNDPVSVTAVALACIAALQGRTTECAAWESRALASAERIGFPRGPFSSAFVSTYLAWIRMMTGDAAGAREFGRRALDIAAERRFDYFNAVGGPYELVPEPGLPVDAAQLERCELAMDLVGHGAFRPAFLGIMARNHAYLGDLDAALDKVGDALARVQKSGETVHQPDLLCLRADLTLEARPERSEDAVLDLKAAIGMGLDQGSFVFALRAANRLGRLPDAIRPVDWRDSVRRALEGFPPDSASPELIDALSILGE
jgi:class 3 adenylate cyclase